MSIIATAVVILPFTLWTYFNEIMTCLLILNFTQYMFVKGGMNKNLFSMICVTK